MCRVLSMQGALDLILALEELVLHLIHFESAHLLSRIWVRRGWGKGRGSAGRASGPQGLAASRGGELYTRVSLL